MPNLDAILVVQRPFSSFQSNSLTSTSYPSPTGLALNDFVCHWVICFMPSTMAFVPSFGVRPEGPCTRNGFQRSSQGAKQYT